MPKPPSTHRTARRLSAGDPHRKVPAYCLHKATGQGVVYINRREIYLGPYVSAESMQRYSQVIAQWQAGGTEAVCRDAVAELTVLEPVARFGRWAQTRYTRAPQELSAYAVATRRRTPT